jgi:hypothetical protein
VNLELKAVKEGGIHFVRNVTGDPPGIVVGHMPGGFVEWCIDPSQSVVDVSEHAVRTGAPPQHEAGKDKVVGGELLTPDGRAPQGVGVSVEDAVDAVVDGLTAYCLGMYAITTFKAYGTDLASTGQLDELRHLTEWFCQTIERLNRRIEDEGWGS